MRVPYPDNYKSLYQARVSKILVPKETEKCRAEYSGGLCTLHLQLQNPSIDDLGNSNYTEFREEGAKELNSTTTGSVGFWTTWT